MNQLQKKLGPLKTWQWLVLGTGAGVGWYLWKRSHEKANPEVNPEAEEKLLGALSRQAGGGGGGESSGGGSVAAPGPIGLSGEAGSPGIAGPQGEAFNPAPIEGRLSSVEQQLATNHPVAALSHTTAPNVNPQHLTRNPANGESYKTVHKNGQTYHEYPHRKGPTKLVRIGGAPHGKPTGHAQKPKPAKRPKPVPIHKRVSTPPRVVATHAQPTTGSGARRRPPAPKRKRR